MLWQSKRIGLGAQQRRTCEMRPIVLKHQLDGLVLRPVFANFCESFGEFPPLLLSHWVTLGVALVGRELVCSCGGAANCRLRLVPLCAPDACLVLH
jgi:hypothetical protein